MSNAVHRARFMRDHHWAPRQMSAYLDGELVSRARERLDRHTTECPECRGVLHSLQRLLGLLHALPAPRSHSDAPDMAALVMARLHEPPQT